MHDNLQYNFDTGYLVMKDLFLATESSKRMDGSLLKACDATIGTINICPALHNRIIHYCRSLFTRSENVEWFGSNLLGVHTIRFYDNDRNVFFEEIIGVEEDIFTEHLRSTDIRFDWKVTSDAFALAIVYLVRMYYPYIDKDKLAREACASLVSLLQFKYYSSIYSHFFPKEVDLPAAEGTYAVLSLKFAIKQMGSWGAVIRERSEQFISNTSPHYKNIKSFKVTTEVIYFISDLNTRTKQTVKDYYGVLDRVRNNNLRINTESAKIDLDGESILKDRTNSFNTAKGYLLDSSTSPTSMYKYELANVVSEFVPKASPVILKEMLESIANLPFGKERDKMEGLLVMTLEHAFEYIVSNRIKFTDVTFLLTKMKALYMSSTTSNERILTLRTELERYVKKNSHLRNDAALAAMRNALLMYFLVRALSANVYS